MKKIIFTVLAIFLFATSAGAVVYSDNITTNECTTVPFYAQKTPCGTKIDNTTIEWNVGGSEEFVLYYGYPDTLNGSSDITTVTFKTFNSLISSTVPYQLMDEDAVTEKLEAFDFKFDNSTQYGAAPPIKIGKRVQRIRAYISIDNSTRCPNLSIKGDYR